jgi:multicomponent Na+:H+ antiporter subunit D
MIDNLPPGLILILGALLVPFLRGKVQATWMLLLPAASLYQLIQMPADHVQTVTLLEYTLTWVEVDKMSLLFGYIFCIAAFIGVLYSFHLKDTVQNIAVLIYAGSALGAVFAGDLITLFLYWEGAAISSVFLIWARRTEKSYHAGMRYLIMQVASGVILLGGVLLHFRDTGSLDFGKMELGSMGTWLIFFGFGIKCAFPLLHTWLTDAYPEGTITGMVFLSSFTTKLGIYAMARGFAGTDELIWIGAVMTIFPIFYAVIENDLRRVLAYSMINQIGFMVVGIGIGTDLAVNGAVAHAFADILFKGLLLMTMGAILLRVGHVNASDLGALYKSMPVTTFFCLIGAASISAFPLFSAFITKSMVLTAAADGNYQVLWMILMFASAGVLHHAGIKIPFYGFFGEDKGLRCKEAPINMLFAMAIAAIFCVGIGSFPSVLYGLLPFEVNYHPYDGTHIITQLQLLFFAILAFIVLKLKDIEPHEIPGTNIDFDWVYRKLGPLFWNGIYLPIIDQITSFQETCKEWIPREFFGIKGGEKEMTVPRAMVTSTAALVILMILLGYLVLDFYQAL